jgi:hypothetical protein
MKSDQSNDSKANFQKEIISKVQEFPKWMTFWKPKIKVQRKLPFVQKHIDNLDSDKVLQRKPYILKEKKSFLKAHAKSNEKTIKRNFQRNAPA